MVKYRKILNKLTTAKIHKDAGFKSNIKDITPKGYNALTLFYSLAIIGSVVGVGIATTDLIKNGNIFNLDKRDAIGLLVQIALIFTVLLLLTGCRIYNALKETKNINIERIELVKIPNILEIVRKDKGTLEEVRIEDKKTLQEVRIENITLFEELKYSNVNLYFNADNATTILQKVIDICDNNNVSRDKYTIIVRNSIKLDLYETEKALAHSNELKTDSSQYPTRSVPKNVITKLSFVERLFNDFGRGGKR